MNVVNLAEYRKESGGVVATSDRTDDELRAMGYDDVLDWAGGQFDRLVIVARARDYYPTWITHQLEHDMTPPQAVIMSRMVAEAGPYLSKRQRWVVKQLREKPVFEQTLVNRACRAAEYRDYKHPDRCIRADICKLIELGHAEVHAGVVFLLGQAVGGGERSPGEATPHITGVST